MIDRLMTITRHDGDELRIDIETYKGHTFLSLRTYFDASDGDMRPTKKGMSVSLSALRELQAALGRALGNGTVTSLAAHNARSDLINNQVNQVDHSEVIDPIDGDAA